MDSIDKNIGVRIAKIIDSRNIKKIDFAAELNIAPSYVTKLIKNEGQPSERLIEDICEKMGINRNWLLNGGPDIDMRKKDFEVDELSEYCAEISEGKDPFLADMLLKYRALSPRHKQAIWEIYEEWTKKKED